MNFLGYFFVSVFVAFCMMTQTAYAAEAAACMADEESFSLGTKYGRDQNHDKAIEMFTRFINANINRRPAEGCAELSVKNLASAYYNRGNAHLIKLDTAKALPDFSEAIRLNPKVPGYYYYRGLAFAKDQGTAPELRREKRNADFVEATKLDQKYGLWALFAFGHDPQTYKVVPEYASEANDFKIILDAGMDVNLADDEGRTALMYAAGWGHGEALKYLLSRGASPNRADRHGSTALIFALAEGRDNIAVLLEPSAKSAKEYRTLAAWYLNRKDYPRAAVNIEKSQKIDAENPDTQFVLGNILLAQKNYDGAISAFQKTLSLSPNHQQALFKLSVCYSAKAAQKAPEDYSLKGSQAAAYLKSGDVEAAVELYGKAFELVVKNMEKEKSVSRYQSASWYAIFLSKFLDAEKYIASGFALDPKATNLRSNLGHLYLLQGRKADALTEYRKYIEQDSSKSMGWFINSLEDDFTLLKIRYPEKKALIDSVEAQLYAKN